jgi:tetratricopeptide (TPR) repeat protein
MSSDPHPQAAIPEAAQLAFDNGAREFVAGDNPAAIDHLKEAVATAPDFDAALYLLALAHLRVGARDEAVVALRRAATATRNVMLRGYITSKLAALGEPLPE